MILFPAPYDETKKKIINGYRLESPPLLEDIEDGAVWYREVMLQCWEAHPDDRPAISDLREKLESLYTPENVIQSQDTERRDEESRVENGYIQLNANNQLVPMIHNPVVNNPGYQVHTMSQSGSIVLNSKPLEN